MREVGNDPDAIRKLTDAGRGCGKCLESSCEDVDLPFPDALKAAESLIKQG
jgi:NAD(P)H-nitrite reductase large subunit